MLQLDLAGPDDWVAWRRMRLRALGEDAHAFSSTLSQWEGAGEDRWRARLSSGTHDVLARWNGDPCGQASGWRDRGRCEVVGMWVAPEVRGRGVGDALVGAVARWATGLGAPDLWLSVKRANAPAIRLYERCGFVPAGDADEPDEMRMVLPIGAGPGRSAR